MTMREDLEILHHSLARIRASVDNAKDNEPMEPCLGFFVMHAEDAAQRIAEKLGQASEWWNNGRSDAQKLAEQYPPKGQGVLDAKPSRWSLGEHETRTCGSCNGRGKHPRAEALQPGEEHSGTIVTCRQCDGTGKGQP